MHLHEDERRLDLVDRFVQQEVFLKRAEAAAADPEDLEIRPRLAELFVVSLARGNGAAFRKGIAEHQHLDLGRGGVSKHSKPAARRLVPHVSERGQIVLDQEIGHRPPADRAGHAPALRLDPRSHREHRTKACFRDPERQERCGN